MANRPDNDPEEDYNKPKGGDNSDEDFGLPDFEYEELSDDDEEDESSTESNDDDYSSSSYSSDSSDDDSFDSGVSEYSSDTDSYKSDNDFGSFDQDEEEEIDLDLSTDSIDFSTDYKGSSYSSDSDFDDSQFSDDDFKEFEPSDNTDFMGNYRNAASESQGKGGFTKIIVFGVILFFLIAAGLMYFNSSMGDTNSTSEVVKVEKSRPASSKKAEKAKEEAEPVAQADPEVANDQPAEQVDAFKDEPKKEEPKKDEPIKQETKREEPKKEEPKKQEPKAQPATTTQPRQQQPAATTASKPAAVTSSAASGQIIRLTNSTGRSYIIAGSFVDEDMASDLCNKLISQGVSNPMIIPPFNDAKYYRVALADFATFQDAAAALADYRAKFGNDVWALRY